MALSKFKIKKGTNLEPQAALSNSVKGDLEVDSASGKLYYHDGSINAPLVSVSGSDVLINKTIDADLNTITNIDNNEIKALAGIDTTKLADGSVSNTEFQYLDGASGNLQTQLNTKAAQADLTAHTGASSGVHGVSGSVVGTTDNQVLSNKTIDGDVNTVQDLALTSLKTVLASSGTFLVRDASGVAVDGTKAVPAGVVVGTTDTQILTNKDIDGGTASNTSRITLPKAAKATLDALTRKEGTLVYASDEDKVYVDDGANLISVGSGQGGINYVLNPDAETGTTGWATYADAAGVAPVDGTGGSPNITLTRNTTTPLIGLADFLITKDAANRQGQGVSYDLTIDRAFQGNNLLVSFNYTTSANYASGDMRAYMYDVTNAQLIELPVRDLDATSIPGQYTAAFQANSNSLSYRLILHIASTNASAYTVNFDNVSVGPSVLSAGGAIVTPWETKALTMSWVSNATISGKSRRVGDSLEIYGRVNVTGTPTSTTLDITVPDGLVIDTAKLPTGFTTNDGILGEAQVWSSANGNIRVPAWAVFNTSTVFSFTCQGGGATTTNVLSRISQATSQPQAFANGDSVSFRVLLPIVGWTAGLEEGTFYNNKEISFAVNKGGSNQTGINPNATSVKITFNTKEYDTTGSFDTTNSRFVAPVAGRYHFDATLQIDSANLLANIYVISWFVNGVFVKGSPFVSLAAGNLGVLTLGGNIDYSLNKGDYVEVFLFGQGNNSASTLTARGGTTQTFFSGHKINTVVSALNTPSQAPAYVGVNPQVGGSSPFQMLGTDSKTQVLTPAGAITVRLPSSGVIAGEIVTIKNNSTNLVSITSSDGDALYAVNTGYVSYVALQAVPTDSTHWSVLEINDRVSGTVGSTGTFTSGGAYVINRVQNTVTMIITTAIAHSSSATPLTAASFLPTKFTPSAEVATIAANDGTVTELFRVNSSGQIGFVYRALAGGATTAQTTSIAGTMATWIVV